VDERLKENRRKMPGRKQLATHTRASNQLDGVMRPDFSDPESLSVLEAASLAVAYELGREAAREYLAELNAHQGSAR
jgi:hypothetical protein